jgi:hypothetical protein
MSKEALISLVGKAALDKTFLGQLRDNSVKMGPRACGHLTVEEIKALNKINFASLEKLNNTISARRAAATFGQKMDG